MGLLKEGKSTSAIKTQILERYDVTTAQLEKIGTILPIN
jgi:hypothetical protein